MAATSIARSSVPATMSDEEFVAFYEKRTHGERWQLIDGEVAMMNPPKLRHQVIAGTLARLMNNRFAEVGSDFLAIQEAGLMVPGVRRFRPQADLAVVRRSSVDLDTPWADRFLLACEVRSESNSAARIERKRLRYMEHPDYLYVLVMGLAKVEIEVWARRENWKAFALHRLDDRLELSELDVSITLRAIYAGVGLDGT